MANIEIVKLDMNKLVSNPNPYKALGPDGIQLFLRRDYAETLGRVIKILFENSLGRNIGANGVGDTKFGVFV